MRTSSSALPSPEDLVTGGAVKHPGSAIVLQCGRPPVRTSSAAEVLRRHVHLLDGDTGGRTVGCVPTVDLLSGVGRRIEGDVDSRIRAIRDRLGLAARPASGAQLVADTPTFDPFGLAYQQALSQVTPGSSSSGFTGSVGAAPVEAAPTRVAGRSSTTAIAAGGPSSSGALSGTDVARYAYDAGFRGDDLVAVVAIAKRESNWTPSAFNGNTGTSDRSYGLMQINMLGTLGPARLSQFGITDERQLLDPQTNMDAAFTLYRRAGNTLHAWGGYKGQPNTFGTDLDGARAAVVAAGLLDAP